MEISLTIESGSTENGATNITTDFPASVVYTVIALPLPRSFVEKKYDGFEAVRSVTSALIGSGCSGSQGSSGISITGQHSLCMYVCVVHVCFSLLETQEAEDIEET